jgi:hypothetical protein
MTPNKWAKIKTDDNDNETTMRMSITNTHYRYGSCNGHYRYTAQIYMDKNAVPAEYGCRNGHYKYTVQIIHG